MFRWLSVAALLLGLTAIPVTRVAACSCAMVELPQAVRTAEVAFIGTLQRTDPPIEGGAAPLNQVAWTWSVERSRDPLAAQQVTISGWRDDGANCGVAFEADQRWLVLAYLEESRLTTNGCMANRLLDGTDPEAEAMIAELLPTTGPPSPSEPRGLEISTPMLVLLGGVAAVGVVSVLAFRRGRPS